MKINNIKNFISNKDNSNNILKLENFDKDFIDKLRKNHFLKNEKEQNLNLNLRCSQLGKCPKEQIFNKIGVPKNDNININWKLDGEVGTYIHEKLQKDYIDLGLIEKDREGNPLVEVFVSDPLLSLTGHVDYITNTNLIFPKSKIPFYRILGEIKTVSHSKFNKIKRLNKPLPEHLEQNNLYMYKLDIEYSLFTYIERGSTNNKVSFLYKRDNEIIEDCIKKCNEINIFLSMGGKFPSETTIYDDKGNKKKVKTKFKNSRYDLCFFCRYTDICDNIDSYEDLYNLYPEICMKYVNNMKG